MKIYVFAEAYTPTEEYAEIMQTKVFTAKEDATEYLYQTSKKYLNHPEDGDHWKITYEDSMCFHAIYDGNKDEVVMTISEHEI